MARSGSPSDRRRPRSSGPQPLFVFVLEGDDPRGFRRCLLAFASAPNEGMAGKLADDRLLALGWRDLELQAVKSLDPALQAAADPVTRDAMAAACADGFAMIVY